VLHRAELSAVANAARQPAEANDVRSLIVFTPRPGVSLAPVGWGIEGQSQCPHGPTVVAWLCQWHGCILWTGPIYWKMLPPFWICSLQIPIILVLSYFRFVVISQKFFSVI